VVSFCYVDGARAKPSGFETYLEHYRAVFSSLSSFEVVYVAIDPQMFPKAERVFARCFRAPLCNPEDPLLAGLREHFRIRELFERQGSRGLDQQRLDCFRDQLEEYHGPQFEALYQRWKGEGNSGLPAGAATNHVRQCSAPGGWPTSTNSSAMSLAAGPPDGATGTADRRDTTVSPVLSPAGNPQVAAPTAWPAAVCSSFEGEKVVRKQRHWEGSDRLSGAAPAARPPVWAELTDSISSSTERSEFTCLPTFRNA